MLEAADVLSLVERAIPKIKTLLQLSGFVAGLAVFLIAHYRGSTTGQLIAGFIGISVIIFSLAFNIVPSLPLHSRAPFILTLYGAFLVALLILSIAAYWFVRNDISQAWRQETQQRFLRLQADAESRLKEAQTSADDARRQREMVDSKAATSAIRAEAVATQVAADAKLDRARQEFKYASNLLESLNSPRSELAEILKRVDTSGFKFPSIISTANASEVSEVREKLLTAGSGNYVYVGWLNQVDGHLDRARALLEAARQADPGNLMALEAIANLHATVGEYDKASRDYDQLILLLSQRAEPGDAMWRALAQKDRGTLARLMRGPNDPDRYYMEALATYAAAPKSEQDPVVLANIDNEYAQFLEAEGKRLQAKRLFDDALAYFSKADSDKYGYPHLLTSIGQFEVSECRFAAGIDFLRKSLSAQASTLGMGTQVNAITLEQLGNALIETGDYEQASTDLTAAAQIIDRLEPESDRRANADFDRARADFLRGHERDEAVRAMTEDLVKLDNLIGATKPWSLHRRYLLARELRFSGEVGEARSIINNVALDEDQSSEAIFDLITERLVLRGLGQSKIQKEDFDKFLSETNSVGQSTNVGQNIRMFLAKSFVESTNWGTNDRLASYCQAIALANQSCPANAQLHRDLEFAKSHLPEAPSCGHST